MHSRLSSLLLIGLLVVAGLCFLAPFSFSASSVVKNKTSEASIDAGQFPDVGGCNFTVSFFGNGSVVSETPLGSKLSFVFPVFPLGLEENKSHVIVSFSGFKVFFDFVSLDRGVKISLVGSVLSSVAFPLTFQGAFSLNASKCRFSSGFLSFDYSDCQSSVLASSNILSFRLNGSFDIDPSLVEEVSSTASNGYPCQRKDWYANGLYWKFYCAGSQMRFRASSDNVTWSASTNIRACVSGVCFSVWCNDTHFAYAFCSGNDGDDLYFCIGLANSNGTITWSSEQTIYNCVSNARIQESIQTPSICFDSSGYAYVSYGYAELLLPSYSTFLSTNIKTDGTWTTRTGAGFPKSLDASNSLQTSIVPLNNTNVYVVMGGVSPSLLTGALWTNSTGTLMTEAVSTSVNSYYGVWSTTNLNADIYNVFQSKNTYAESQTVQNFDWVFYGSSWNGQTFTVQTDCYLTRVSFWLKKSGSGTAQAINVMLYETSSGLPTGSPLSVKTISAFSTSTYSWKNVTWTVGTESTTNAISINSSKTYALMLYSPLMNSTNYYAVGRTSGSGSDLYLNGKGVATSNNGSSYFVYNDLVDTTFQFTLTYFPIIYQKRLTSWSAETQLINASWRSSPTATMDKTNGNCYFTYISDVTSRDNVSQLILYANGTLGSKTVWFVETDDLLQCTSNGFYALSSNLLGLSYMTTLNSTFYKLKFMAMSIAAPVTKIWQTISTWTFQLTTRQWNNVGTWTFQMLTKQWSIIATWLFQLDVKGWHTITSWLFILESSPEISIIPILFLFVFLGILIVLIKKRKDGS